MCLHFFDEYFHEVLTDMRKYFRREGLWQDKKLTVEELVEEINTHLNTLDSKAWAIQNLTQYVFLLHDLILTLRRNKFKDGMGIIK